MSWAAGISAGLQVAGGVASYFGGKEAEKAREQAYRDQAKYTYQQRMEELRRQQREDALIKGQAVAGAYASNVQANQGSPARYLEDLQAEQRRQQAYFQFAAKREKTLIEETGQSPGADIAAIGNAASTLANAFATYRSLTA